MSAREAATLMGRLYAAMGRMFPEEFQRACGREMTALTAEMLEETAAERGYWGLAPLVLRVMADVVAQLIREWTQELWGDAKYAGRLLWGAPGFTAVSVFSLTIGIGMVTVMYSQLESTVFRAIPGVSRAKELVATERPVAYPTYAAFRDESGQFASVAAYLSPVVFATRVQGRQERVWGHLVTGNYFDVLQVGFVRGRGFGEAEAKRQAAPTVVVSYRFWRNKLLSDPDVIGSKLVVNHHPATIVGVAADGFLGPVPLVAAADVFVPVTAQATVAPELARGPLEERRLATFSVVGRLAKGVKKDEAEKELDAMVRRMEQAEGDPNRERGGRRVRLLNSGRVVPVDDADLPAVTAVPALLSGLTLWIACANVGTMMLVRAARRRKEISIRLAIGASRVRIMRLLLAECVLLGLLGGVGGILFTLWNFSATESFRPVLPNHMELGFVLDWRTYVANFAVSMVAAFLFGLAPALQTAKVDLTPAMKAGALTQLTRYRWFSFRNMLVLQQVAGSLALLLITGYVVLGFERSSRVDVGFEARNLTTMSVDPVREGYSKERAMAFFAKLPEHLERTPGVERAALAQSEPLTFMTAEMVNTKYSMGEEMKAAHRMRREKVGYGYFEAVGIQLVKGRGFVRDDEEKRRAVVVVNETMAKEVWAGKNAVGQTLELEGKQMEVIGVARDVRSGFAFEVGRQMVYSPIDPAEYGAPRPEGVTVVVRTTPGVDAAAAVRGAVAQLDSELTVFRVRPMTQTLADLMYLVKLTISVYGGIGVFGLVLAVIGLGGVTAYAVALRTREIGIRMALGAPRAHVLGLVMREGAWLTGLGLVLGQAAAYGITQALRANVEMFAEVLQMSISDPVLVIGAPALLGGLTLLACYLPARRATVISPVTALRQD